MTTTTRLCEVRSTNYWGWWRKQTKHLWIVCSAFQSKIIGKKGILGTKIKLLSHPAN